jgi:hypothetical protein
MSNPFDTAFTQFFITDNASFGRKIDLNKLATQVKNSKAKPIVNEFIQGRTDKTLDSKDEYEAFLTTWGNFNLKNGRGKGIDQISASQLSNSDGKTQAEGELRELFFDSTNPQGLTIKSVFIDSIKPDNSVPNNTAPAVTVTPNTPPLTNNDDTSKILTLSSSMLTATDDVTKKPENLTYTLGDIAGGEVKKDATALATGGKFTQKEIDQGKITFVWDGTEPQPKFNFTVSDNAANPGVSQPQEFKVAVTTVGGTQSPNTTVTPLNAAIDERPNTRSMDGVGKNFNGYKDIKTPFPNPFNKDEYSKIEIQNNQGAVIATYENKEGGSTTLLVGDGKDGFYFDPGTEDFNPTEYKVVLTKASDSTTTTEIPLAGNTITKAERNIVLNTPTEAAAIKTGENLVLSAKFPTGEEGDFYDATQLEKSGLSLNLAITVGGEVKTITVPLKGLTVAPEAEGSTKLNIPIPPDKLSNIKGQITKIDFSASTMEPSDTTKTATIDSLNIDFSGNTSIPTPTNNNQNQTSVVPNNTTTTNNTVQSSSTPSSSTASTMNPPPITVGNRTITGSESAVILQAALRNNKDSQGKPYYSGLITGNWDEPSANALKKYIADNNGKPIEKTLPKGTENVSGKLIGSWSSGDDVKTVQQTLNTKANDLKIAKLAEDGQFGPQTEAAIKAFQEYYNTKNTVKPIKIDGILGPETELAMNTQFNMTLFKTT